MMTFSWEETLYFTKGSAVTLKQHLPTHMYAPATLEYY